MNSHDVDKASKRKREPHFHEPIRDVLSAMNIIGEVGNGAYGVVYRAQEKATNEMVALKKIKMDKEFHGFPVTAIREIKFLKQMKNESIVRLKEIVTYNGSKDGNANGSLPSNINFLSGDVFMVFEYCPFDLAGLIHSRQVKFSPEHIQSYTLQLMEGMRYLSKNSILHRDIKGANILVTVDNRIKIADFGLSRSQNSTDNVLTNEKKVVTLWYRSPELLLGVNNYGPEIDMWSVGCLFAELFTLNFSSPALFQGQAELDQLDIIFKLVGSPTGDTEEIYRKYPLWSAMMNPPLATDCNSSAAASTPTSGMKAYPPSIPERFKLLTPDALDMLIQLLHLNPKKRLRADQAKAHPYLTHPTPVQPHLLRKFENVQAGHESEAQNLRKEQRALEKAQYEEAQRTGVCGRGGGRVGMREAGRGGRSGRDVRPGGRGYNNAGRGGASGKHQFSGTKEAAGFSLSKPGGPPAAPGP